MKERSCPALFVFTIHLALAAEIYAPCNAFILTNPLPTLLADRCSVNPFSRQRRVDDSSHRTNSHFSPHQTSLSRLKLLEGSDSDSNCMDYFSAAEQIYDKRSHSVGRRLFIWHLSYLAMIPLASAYPAPSMEVYGQPESVQGFNPLDPLLSLLGRASANRPPPVKIPRISLFRQFAVLLMRSSYEAVDDLDFVPMDRFQKEFFLLRADEWEIYRAETEARQGDLSNALYFDFISAAQYATITKLMKEGQMVFEERIGAEGQVQMVQRDPSVSNSMLRPIFFEKVGDRLLEALYRNFTGPDFFTQPPQPCGINAPAECVVAGLSQLYQIFYENGYAKEITVTDGGEISGQQYIQELGRLQASASTFRPAAAGGSLSGGAGSARAGLRAGRRVVVKLQVPCTLWGHLWLQSRRDILNDHDVMWSEAPQDMLNNHDVVAVAAFVRRCGRQITVRSTVDGNSYTREFNIL